MSQLNELRLYMNGKLYKNWRQSYKDSKKNIINEHVTIVDLVMSKFLHNNLLAMLRRKYKGDETGSRGPCFYQLFRR